MVRGNRLARLALVVGAVAASAVVLATSAYAADYWNVWQGNLPGSDGVRSHHSAYGGGTWFIRESWTSGTHDMHFSWIGNNGSWLNASVFVYGSYWINGSVYDEYVEYGNDTISGGVAKGGCQNPAGYSTVYTNCRNHDLPLS